MASTSGVLVDDNVLEVLRKAQLDTFVNKFVFLFNVRRFDHFSHVRDKDMQDIGMHQQQIRQLREQILKMSREMWNRSDPKQVYLAADQSMPVQSSIDEKALIPNEQIKLYEQLGEGSFAVVKRGTWAQGNGQHVDVAVKILRDISPNIMDDLRVEASHLLKLQHPSLIRLYGIVRQPAMMVVELCEGGSLLDRLRDDKKPVPLLSQLHDYCIQIANALLFLVSKQCVHRDVAARNIYFAKDEKTVKICEIDLMQEWKTAERLFSTIDSQKEIPFAWDPPEVIRRGLFSNASDVWAYGVTLWEIYTFGEEPWVGRAALDVLKNIDAGERLEKPKYCSERIYQIMQDSWKSNPAERCKFGTIREDLKASMFLDAIARETYHSIQPGTLQLVKGDEVVVVENTGQDWFGQNKKNREFGTFPRSVVSAQSENGMTRPRQASSNDPSTSVPKSSTSQQQNPLQKALTDELKGNLNRRPTSAGSNGNGNPLHRNGVSQVSQPISQQPLPPQVVPTNQAPKLNQPQQVRLPPPVITAPIAPTPAAHAPPSTANVVSPTQAAVKAAKALKAANEKARIRGLEAKGAPSVHPMNIRGKQVSTALPAQSAVLHGSSSTSALQSTTSAGQSDDVDIANKNDYTKFVTKSDDVLWEDDNIRIGCKLETRKDSGRLEIVYGNKTSQPFNKFTPTITCPGALAAQLQAQANPVKQRVAAGAQVRQLINFVCVQEFQETPIMNIKFSFIDRAGALQDFDKNFYLPLFISKFFEPTNMTSKQFTTRWTSLGSSQAAQKTFKAQSMETANIETKLKGFGATLLTDVDPNPKKYECAGIIHTQTQQIGTLIRLKPSKRDKTHCLTIRSSKDTVGQTLVDLLEHQF